MKRFLKKIIWFVLPLVIAAYPLDRFISIYLSKSKNFALGEISIWKDIYQKKIDADIVIYGSSRAVVQFNPELLQSTTGYLTYNLGIDGSTFLLQYLRHTEYISRNRKPEYIIYSVDATTFVRGKGLYNKDQLLPFALFNSNAAKIISEYQQLEVLDSYLPMIRYTGRSEAMNKALEIAFFNRPDSSKRKKGFEGRDLKWNSDFEEAKLEMKQFVPEIDSVFVHQFDNFLKEAKNDGIKVILVYSPEYFEGQKFIKDREKIMALYRKCADDYQIPFFDYSNDSLCLNKELFYNTTHLNKKGADLFSKKLASDLRSGDILKAYK